MSIDMRREAAANDLGVDLRDGRLFVTSNAGKHAVWAAGLDPIQAERGIHTSNISDFYNEVSAGFTGAQVADMDPKVSGLQTWENVHTLRYLINELDIILPKPEMTVNPDLPMYVPPVTPLTSNQKAPGVLLKHPTAERELAQDGRHFPRKVG